VAGDAGFHGEVFVPGQDFPGTDLSVAVFTLELGIEVRFVAKKDKVRNRESPPVCGVVFEARLTTGGDPRVEAISVALGAH